MTHCGPLCFSTESDAYQRRAGMRKAPSDDSSDRS
jgi:hypothetical protein